LYFTGLEGLDKGLVDRISNFKLALSNFEGDVNRTGARQMATYSQEDHDKAVAAARKETADQAAAKAAEDTKKAAAAERVRIQGIMGCEEAKGKQKLAAELAYDEENLSLATCQRLLKAAALETPVKKAAVAEDGDEDEDEVQPKRKAGSTFDDVMDRTAPKIKPAKGKKPKSEDDEEADAPPDDISAGLVSDYRKASGYGLKPETKQ
jgi:hypothetical protein